MTWIKICGITNLEDALAAAEAGADALGFVFYENSPRRVDAARVREIVKRLPNAIEKIGVFVMATDVEMHCAADEAQLTGWQLHNGVNGTAVERALRIRGLFPLSKSQSHAAKNVYVSVPASLLVNDEGYRHFAWPQGTHHEISALLVDSSRAEMPGGTGGTFDWERLQHAIQRLSRNFNVIVAGGLTANNVGQAMSILHPWGVDVSSGVETTPGKKDREKICAFIRAVREADKENSN
jgi:phosphoribosylanthranilate isomerase